MRNLWQETTMNGTVQITLTRIELGTLQRMQKHLPEVVKLMDGGVFDLKNGQATIHKDSNGKVRRVELREVTFTS